MSTTPAAYTRPLLHGYRVITRLFFYEYFFCFLIYFPILFSRSQASSRRRRRRRSACLRPPDGARLSASAIAVGAQGLVHARTRPTIHAHTRCFSRIPAAGFGSTTRFPRKPARSPVGGRCSPTKNKNVYYQSPRSSAAAAAQPYPRTFRLSTTTTTTKRPTRIPNVPHATHRPGTIKNKVLLKSRFLDVGRPRLARRGLLSKKKSVFPATISRVSFIFTTCRLRIRNLVNIMAGRPSRANVSPLHSSYPEKTDQDRPNNAGYYRPNKHHYSVSSKRRKPVEIGRHVTTCLLTLARGSRLENKRKLLNGRLHTPLLKSNHLLLYKRPLQPMRLYGTAF